MISVQYWHLGGVWDLWPVVGLSDPGPATSASGQAGSDSPGLHQGWIPTSLNTNTPAIRILCMWSYWRYLLIYKIFIYKIFIVTRQCLPSWCLISSALRLPLCERGVVPMLVAHVLHTASPQLWSEGKTVHWYGPHLSSPWHYRGLMTSTSQAEEDPASWNLL